MLTPLAGQQQRSRKHFKNLSLNKKKNKVSESINFKIEQAKADITDWAESGDRSEHLKIQTTPEK